jgi:hypothetical protein
VSFDGRYPQFLAWRDKIYGYAMAFVLWGGGETYHARGCKYISYIMGVFLYYGFGMLIKWGGISDFRFQLMKTTITHPPTSC